MIEGLLVVNIFELICLFGILILKAYEMDRKGKEK